jgi:hypothetical protein
MIEVRPASKNDFEPRERMRAALWPCTKAQEHFAETKEVLGKEISFKVGSLVMGESMLGMALFLAHIFHYL